MASPFTIFRRHQKVMIAVLTLLAMFAFVFLDPLLDHLGGGAGSNPVVVTTQAYGDLRESDISNLVRQRQLVLNVLRQALSGGGMHPAVIDYWLRQRFGGPTEEAVVQTWLHAQRAENLGMVVDDRAVNDFLNLLLQELTENKVGIGEIAGVLERDKVPQRIFFNALRKELLARQFQQSFQLSLMGIPPMQRWDYYKRLNLRAEIKLVPVSVVDFMDQIEDPGEDALQAFFEEHKSTEWRPDIPEPAFRQPKRIALQYFKAELDDFVKLDSVTDEEIARYYEENKETRYLRPQASAPGQSEMPPASSDSASQESGEEPAGEKPAPPAGDQPAEEQPEQPAAEQPGQPAKEQPGDAKPSPETPMGGDEPAPETVKPTDAAGEPEENQPSEPMAEPADEPADADSSAPASEPARDGAAMRPSQPGARFMFTSYQVEDEADVPKSDEPAKETTESADVGAMESPMSEPAKATEPKPESKEREAMATEPAPESPAPESPAPESPAPESPAPEGSSDEPKVESPEPPPAEPEAEPAAPERSTIDGRPAGTQLYLPLDEVRDEIRHTLARRKAQAELEDVLGSLSSQMQKYYDDVTRYEVRAEDDPKAVKPAELDMGKLAAEHGLKLFSTALISAWEAQSLDIGESLVDGTTPFVRAAFEDLPVFQTAISQSAESYFLFWKTSQEETRVPEWDDENVQAQVLQAWKLVQARTLARAEAEKLAKQVRESGKTLEQIFAEESKVEVVHAGPFSWMTSGDVPAMLAREPPRISEVEGVDFAGQQFMRDVFALGEGEVGVTMNQPETFAYVVRMASLVPPQTILWEGFLVDDFGKYVAAGAPDFEYMQSAWQKEVEEAAGLEWKREPWRVRDSE